jgi:hypothetical protein
MANEQLLRDLFELGNLGLQIYNPEAYKVIEKMDRLASSRYISDRAGNAVAGFSLGARVLAGLQVFDKFREPEIIPRQSFHPPTHTNRAHTRKGRFVDAESS